MVNQTRHARVDNRRKLTGGAILAAVLILAVVIALTVVYASSDGQDTEGASTFNPPADPDARQVTFLDHRRENYQDLTEQQYLEQYRDGDFTVQDPLIILDPYDTAPLTALVMFHTDEPTRVRVTVAGTDDNSSIARTYESYRTEHRVPVLGLYPDSANSVELQLETEDGDVIAESSVTIETEPLPEDFLQPELVHSEPAQMADGLSFMIPSTKYLYAIDANADVRWYSTEPIKLAFERLRNGHIIFATQDEARDQYNQLIEIDMLGKVYNTYVVQIEGYDKSNIIHHDVIELPNGNLLATTHEPDSKYEQDQMIAIDRKTGETLRFINDRDLFPAAAYEEYTGKNADVNDWIHQNAIFFDKDDQSILISGRSQDSILKLSYPDAEIEWILAAHQDWPDSYDKYLLDPVGDVKFPAGQHAMKIMPDQDGDPDTEDILLFDNNTVITRGNTDISDTYSRGVQYRIDEVDKTVEEVWSYGEERGTDFFSAIIGNTQYLPNADNVLITSGAISTGEDTTESRIVEVSHDEDPHVVFEVKTPEFGSDDHRYIYRSFRWPLYPESQWNFSFDPSEE